MILTTDVTDQLVINSLIQERWNAGRRDPIIPNIKQVKFIYKHHIFVGILFYYRHLGKNNPSSVFFMPKDTKKEVTVRRLP